MVGYIANHFFVRKLAFLSRYIWQKRIASNQGNYAAVVERNF